MDKETLLKIETQKTVIYGAGNIARLAIIYIKNTLSHPNVIGCAVSSDNRISSREIERVPIRSIDEYMKNQDDIFFLIAVNSRFNDEIAQELKRRNIKNYAFFQCDECVKFLEDQWKISNENRYEAFKENLQENFLSVEERYAFLSKQLKTTLNFEISIADHCNLNCQSCNHFSPVAKENFVDIIKLEKDLQRIHQIYGKDIGNVMLLGGEPLLHPHINQVLYVSRKYLPDASLSLVTNGILLPKMNEEFWHLMSDLKISLNTTVYPIKFDYKKYEDKAKEYGIKAVFDHSSLGGRKEAVKTTYVMPIKDVPMFNPYAMYAKCAHANFCVVLRNGRIYNCSFTANVHHYNTYFGKNIPSSEDVSIDIYMNERDKIDEFLKLPNKMCSHCDICGYLYDVPWAISKKSVSEWTGEFCDS